MKKSTDRAADLVLGALTAEAEGVRHDGSGRRELRAGQAAKRGRRMKRSPRKRRLSREGETQP